MRSECARCGADAGDCRCVSRAPTPLERRLTAAGAAATAREEATAREREAARRSDARKVLAARAEREGTEVFGAVALAISAHRSPGAKEAHMRLAVALAALDGVQRARVLRLALRGLLDGRGGELWRAPLAAGVYAATYSWLAANTPGVDGPAMACAAVAALKTALKARRWVIGEALADVPRGTREEIVNADFSDKADKKQRAQAARRDQGVGPVHKEHVQVAQGGPHASRGGAGDRQGEGRRKVLGRGPVAEVDVRPGEASAAVDTGGE